MTGGERTSKNNIYTLVLTTKKIRVPFTLVGQNIKDVLSQILMKKLEGKCGPDGFVRPKSTKIITYSSGMLCGEFVQFEVVYECQVCNPVEGMTIRCVVKNIGAAGIRAITSEEVSPVVVYVARDHHYMRPEFSSVKEDDEITVKVIGRCFELNDAHVSVIAELTKVHAHAHAHEGHKK